MNLNEDTGGGGFKFRKRERKHRIKTASDRPEEEEEEQPAPQAAIPVAETTHQAHPQPQQPSTPEREPEQTGLNAEDKEEEQNGANAEDMEEKVEDAEDKNEEDKEENAEANVEEATVAAEGQKEVEKENDTEEAKPIKKDTMGAHEPTSTPYGQSDGKPIRVGASPKKAPKFKQRRSKEFKSKPPKKGVLGFGDEIPGMDGLGTDITVICPWEAFSHLELHELAQFGII